MSAYSHFKKLAGVLGLWVGKAGSEVQVADASGNLYHGGTALTATADEINRMADITATAAEINRVADISARVVNCTASTLALTTALHDGKIVTLNRAAGIAVTLPAATGSGSVFKLIVGTTFTGNATIKVVGDDIMVGQAIFANDSDGSVSAYETAATSDTITMYTAAGNTTGGIAGAVIELIDIAANTWFVNMVSAAGGTEDTPFSATVT